MSAISTQVQGEGNEDGAHPRAPCERGCECQGNDKGPSSNQSPRMAGRGFATARPDTLLHIILLQINYCTTSDEQLWLL